jgi:tetratricopeptide (TPR) repeat protein
MAENPRIEELRRRVQSDPASIAFAALAEEYRRAGLFEEAIATCKAGLQRHPAYLSAHVTLGRALIEVSRFDEARKELEYVLKTAPENLAAIRGLADIHHRRGEVPEEEHYNAALEAAARDAHPREAAHPSPSRGAPPHPAAAAAPAAPGVKPIRVQPAVPTPRANPALAELEAFLAAIVRARGDLESVSATR